MLPVSTTDIVQAEQSKLIPKLSERLRIRFPNGTTIFLATIDSDARTVKCNFYHDAKQKIIQSLHEYVKPCLTVPLCRKHGGVTYPKFRTAVIFLRQSTCPGWNMLQRCIQTFDVSYQIMKYVNVKTVWLAYYIDEVLRPNKYMYGLYEQLIKKGKKREASSKLQKCVSLSHFFSVNKNEEVFFRVQLTNVQ